MKKYIKKLLKIIVIFLGTTVLLAVLIFGYFNLPVKNKIKNPEMGVTFSQRYSRDIGLNWKENYVAMLDDLQVRKIRIPVYWDMVEIERGRYNFDDLDWQLVEAEKRGAEVILVVGQKVPRWPECFVPEWIKNDTDKNKKLDEFIGVVVQRYKNNKVIKYWQVENEPFLDFGICGTISAEQVDREIAIVKNLDQEHPIMVTDSGELSMWIPVAKRADVFGTTMYRNVYKEGWGYYVYPIGPRFFLFKRWLIEKFANQKNAVVIELQGEPWVSGWTVHQSLDEQFKSMNSKKLADNVEYAQKSGFSEIYVWGVEWWYWIKTTQGDKGEIWETAQKIFVK